jgi:hypothetical protein
MNLGKLEQGDLRKVWKDEASDFTNWLAQEENLTLLSDAIGIDIKPIRTEANVGTFNVDILAEEENSERKVIIENQLEPSDHDHLGKIITYASGYDASIMIWILKDVRDEHKQAIDWLNEHTDENVNFFVVKIEIWKIGDSPYAPRFHIVSKPNDWAKAVKKSATESELTDTKLMQFAYWNKFKEYAVQHKTKLRLRKVYPQHWYNISIGNSECHICLSVNTRDEQIACEVWISQSKELFKKLHEKRDSIEQELNEKLEWMEMPLKKASRIKLSHEMSVNDQENWKKCFKWMLDCAEKFYVVFNKFF